ncbi:hypothetical protein VNI00_004786 [Paramarasmius palmivorus]|uniref:JmjC domain-containing protein n=1 Tax=Paramarasmius palmivorus TaxID=297713 RepID=A0AAW0DIX4_9AGAR
MTPTEGMTPEDKRSQQQKKDKHLHSNPFFLTCTKRNEHGSADFAPVSRFHQKELEEAIQKMEQVVLGCSDDTGRGNGSTGTAERNFTSSGSEYPLVHSYQQQTGAFLPMRSANFEASGSQSQRFSYPQPYPPASSSQSDPDEYYYPVLPSGSKDSIPAYRISRYPFPHLTLPVFQSHWVKGTPLLVEGVLDNFGISWTPDYFIEQYGTQSCIVVECQTETNKRVTVGDFFRQFGDYTHRMPADDSSVGGNQSSAGGGVALGPGRWKLKDWPPSTDFKTAFPELYEDFSKAVPIPNYVRRDGALNIASHFPKNTVAPDLGPKMYNAMASHDQKGSKGSTRLHMDMADALNIMTYAAPAPDGSPGCAAWDLFRCEDSDKLRKFLREKFHNTFQHDPIHSQQVYLDRELREELWQKYQVRSYRVYQRPGEAIFIPAGVAHQVVNLADCIKVAIDFVSPENVERCEKLTREFREQNQSKAWKEDVLQLRSMMWFAWLSCCQQEAQLQKQQRQRDLLNPTTVVH